MLHIARALVLLSTAVLIIGCGSPPADPGRTFPSAALIDPNSVDATVLAGIPGLSEAAVKAIESARPFTTPTQLNAALIDHLSEEQLRAVYEVLFIPVGLNTGALDDYRLIPSTLSPGKLAHEFEEYRPYESIDQFRREMAKYVSAQEVDYLTRYVTLD